MSSAVWRGASSQSRDFQGSDVPCWYLVGCGGGAGVGRVGHPLPGPDGHPCIPGRRCLC